MTRRTMRRGALLSALCLVLAICCIVPSIRGWLTQIAQQIQGREIVYFNNMVNWDDDDTNNYNFGYDRKAAADAAIKAGKDGTGDLFSSITVDPALCAAIGQHGGEYLSLSEQLQKYEQIVTRQRPDAGKCSSVVDWVAKKDGTGDFFYSIAVDPALCAAVALHMDETLNLPEKLLKDEQNVVIGQRADAAHLHFLRDNRYWDATVDLIIKYLTSGSIEVQYIKNAPKSMMYMHYNALEGNKPSVIVRSTQSSKGYVVVFNLGKPGSVRFRLDCGYQPIDVGYWPVPPIPVPPGPEPEPEPTPTLEPKKPDAGPQGQTQHDPNPDFGGGQNHDNDTTYTDQEPDPPAAYTPPPPPAKKPTATPKPTATQAPDSSVVTGDGHDHTPLEQVQQEQHSADTVEEPVQTDGLNEGDLDESAVE